MKIISAAKSGLKIRASVKAGGYCPNHNRSTKAAGLKIRAAIKAGGYCPNHNRSAKAALPAPKTNGTLAVKSAIRAGRILMQNHCSRLLGV